MKRKIIDWTTNHPWQSISLALVLTAILGYGVRYIHIEDDLMKMLPEDIPSLTVWYEIEDQFGSTEPLLVGLGREGQTIYTTEALARTWDYTQAIEQLSNVDEVRSVASISKIESVDGFLEVGDLMPSRELTPEQIDDMRNYLDRNPDIGGILVSTNEDFTILAVMPLPRIADQVLVDSIEAIAERMGDEGNYHLGGLPLIRGIISEIVRNDVIGLMLIGMVLLVLILLVNLRNVPGLLMVLSVIVLAVLAMVGVFGWLFHFTQRDWFNFTLINTTMPVILLTIATADGVHIITRFFREVRERRDVKASVAATMDVLMLPVFLTSITTMAGFVSLVAAPLKPMTAFGFILSFGIAWAWYLSVTLLPSLMVLRKWNLEARALKTAGVFEKMVHWIGRQVLHAPWVIIVGTVMVMVIAIIGISRIQIEVNMVNFFKPQSQVRQNLEFLDEHFYGSANFAVRVTGDLKDPQTLITMQEIEKRLKEEPYIGYTMSMADIIAKLHRVVMDDSAKYEVIPATRMKVSNLLTLYSISGNPEDFSSMVTYDYQTGLITATLKMSSSEELVAMVDRIEADLAKLESDNLQLELTGFPVFMRDFVQMLISSSLRSLALALVLVVILSMFFYNSLRWGILAVIPLGSATILNFGLMGWLSIELSHVTALISSIIIGVGVDFAVHYIAQYKHFLAQGVPRDEVSQVVIDDVGYPILLNVAAVSMGFIALLFSNFVPINYMGGLVIISMVSCALGTLTLLAAVTHIFRNKVPA